MSESYTKLMSSIVQSTVWSESLATKVVWITMLALSDRKGYVGASVPGLAKTAGVTLEECEEALRRLHSPDPYSRTKEHEGRRLATVDRGWLILNYDKIRGQMDSETIKESKRLWWDRHRSKRARQEQSSARSDSTNSTQAEAEAVVLKTRAHARTRATLLPENFKISNEVTAWAEKKGLSHLLEANFERFVSYAKAKGAKYADWDAALMGAVRSNWAGDGAPAKPQAVKVCAYCTAKSIGSANRYEHCFAHKGRALDNEPPQKAKT